jgi:hypothetical protein
MFPIIIFKNLISFIKDRVFISYRFILYIYYRIKNLIFSHYQPSTIPSLQLLSIQINFLKLDHLQLFRYF